MKYAGIELDACYHNQILIQLIITQISMFVDGEV